MSNARKAAAPQRSIADILQLAAPREASVTLCVAGDLAAEAERLTTALKSAATLGPGASLADVDPRAALERELDDVRERMAAAEVTFRFRALPRKDYSDLIAAHPARDKESEAWNVETLPSDLIARCCLDPVMTVAEVEALSDVLNESGRAALFSAAWRANNAEAVVPTSRAASVSHPSSGER